MKEMSKNYRIKLGVFLLFFVCSFSYPQSSGSDFLELSKIKSGIKSKRVSSYDKTGGNNDRFEKIKAGEKRIIFDVNGAGIINHIWITIDPPPEELNRNDIIIRMFWDGNDFPSVESPLGPFFGQGWNESYEMRSLPLAVAPLEGRALISYFNMPFSTGGKIEIENQTDKEIENFYFYVDYLEVESLDENMGRFCAWYNHELTEALPEGENEWDLLPETGTNKKGNDNYLILDVKGKGQFVGVNYYVHSPSPMWYGEGDDMIFIDNNETPELFGTGTEDYFNTSWCPKSVYSHPYFGYPRVNNDIGWLGRTHIYRFHITDPIYFENSFRFTIEHGHNNCLTLDLSSVAYWYQATPLTKLNPTPDKKSRQPKEFIDLEQIHKWRHEWRKNKGNDSMLWGNEK
jgi:hypothetical protein